VAVVFCKISWVVAPDPGACSEEGQPRDMQPLSGPVRIRAQPCAGCVRPLFPVRAHRGCVLPRSAFFCIAVVVPEIVQF